MRKLGFVVVLLLCWALCAPAWAVDVNLGGERIGEAKAVDGATYLPLRVLFDRCGASVDYSHSEKKIVAVRPDGVWFEMWLDSDVARVTENGEVKDVALGRAPYAEDGHVYVPVRFVAENLLCDVDWRDGAVWIEPRYFADIDAFRRCWLTYADGRVHVLEWWGDAMTVAALPEEEMAPLRDGTYQVIGLSVEDLSAGCMITLDLYRDDTALSANGHSSLYVWAEGPDECVVAHNKPLVADDCVYLTSGNYVLGLRGGVDRLAVELDDAEQYMAKWAKNGRVLLQRGAEFVLVDMQTAAVRDLQGGIFSEENRLRLQVIAGVDDEQAAAYWAMLNRPGCLDPHPQVKFIEGNSASLRFRLTAAYTWDESGNYRYFNVEVEI